MSNQPTKLASELRQDGAFALRLLRRSPGFAAAAVLTIAVAIGGNTAVFGVVNALGLKRLTVRAPQQIVRIYTGQSQTSWLNYDDIQRRSTVFAGVAAHASSRSALTDGGGTQRLFGEIVTNNYLSMLGVRAMLGRTLLPSDNRADLIVLGERAWRTRFASDPNIVGRTIALNGRPFEVVGVMPPGFRGARAPGFVSEFWSPIDPTLAAAMLRDRNEPAFEIVARLKDEASEEHARAEVRIIAAQLASEHPTLEKSFTNVEVFKVDGIGGFRGMAGTLAPLFAFVGLLTIVGGLVLLVGCANIAGLLLGRGAARRREIGVRLALGASRGRLIRQLLTESLVLACAGGAAGALLAMLLGAFINRALAQLPIPIEFDLGMDQMVLLYTLALSVFTAVLCGLAPARRSTRLDVFPSLKDDEPLPGRQRLRQWLVAGQVAFSCLLLLWGSLFVRSLAAANRVDPGFDPSGVIAANLDLSELERSGRSVSDFVTELEARVGQLPGVVTFGVSTVVPLTLTGREEYYVRPDRPDAPRHKVTANRLTPGWFQTLRIPLLAGRDFTADDRAGSAPVVIVNETLAWQFWNGDAIGKRLDDREVVGIVRDSKYWTLGEAVQPTVYTPYAQRAFPEANLLVRTNQPAAVAGAIRREIAAIDPQIYAQVTPLTTAVGAALLPAQVGAAATSAFGALGGLLTMMGIYGLVSFTVAQRTREIGIRKAIGATTADIIRVVMRGTLVPVAVGLTIGLIVALIGAVGIRGFIPGISPADPIALIATLVLIAATATCASAIPALRAANLDAMVSLKRD